MPDETSTLRGIIEVPNLDIGGTLLNGLVTFYGSSSHSKPTDATIANGSVFIETDTQKVYMFDETNKTWREW